MNATIPDPRRARRTLLLVFAAFLGPLLIATALYAGHIRLFPGSTNHGRLVAQPVAHPVLEQVAPGRWRYVLLLEGPCGLTCEADLFKLRQLRLALGKESDRVEYLVVGPAGVRERLAGLLDRHPALHVVEDAALLAALREAAGAGSGQTLLVDPLGNVVLAYEAGFNVRPVKKDVLRLLKVSKIG